MENQNQLIKPSYPKEKTPQENLAYHAEGLRRRVKIAGTTARIADELMMLADAHTQRLQMTEETRAMYLADIAQFINAGIDYQIQYIGG